MTPLTVQPFIPYLPTVRPMVTPTGARVTAYRRGRWTWVHLDRTELDPPAWPAHVTGPAADLARRLADLRYDCQPGPVARSEFTGPTGHFHAPTWCADPFLWALLELEQGELLVTHRLAELVRPVVDKLWSAPTKTERRRIAPRLARWLERDVREAFDL